MKNILLAAVMLAACCILPAHAKDREPLSYSLRQYIIQSPTAKTMILGAAVVGGAAALAYVATHPTVIPYLMALTGVIYVTPAIMQEITHAWYNNGPTRFLPRRIKKKLF